MRTAKKKLMITPMRVIVTTLRLSPRAAHAEDSPLIRVWGGVTLTTNPARVKVDLHFKAEVQVNPDYTFEILTFAPLYGSVEGVAKLALTPYKDALEDALSESRLKFLNVS